MGKICSNHLHFLSYLLKCPVDNAGNGVSEPLNLKIFWRSMPQTVILPTSDRLPTSNISPLRTPSDSYATPLKSIRILKTCFSRQFQEDISQVSCYQPSCHFYGSGVSRERLETQLTILKMHAHESSIVLMSPIIEFLDANGIASFNETVTVLVKLILVMPATNALSERSYSALKKNLDLP